VVYSKLLSSYLGKMGKTKKDSGQLVWRPRSEPGTSRIQVTSVTVSANLLSLNKDDEFKFKSNIGRMEPRHSSSG
jgi:hypothetical protein